MPEPKINIVIYVKNNNNKFIINSQYEICIK